ncbi:MAG: HD-GYP domain-containing protein [Firmicutes bacterium]|nr:HD-GYP domain-containing protein [Bacillota bacterium]
MVCQRPLASLGPGVTLARPVTDAAGNVLLPQGLILDECLLHLLHLWNVESIFVDGQGPEVAGPEPAPLLDKRFQQDLLQDIQLLEAAISSDKRVSVERLATQLRHAVNHLSRQPRLGLSLMGLQRIDDYTYLHSLSTALISMGIAIKLGWSQTATVELGLAAVLHDMGKTMVPRTILQKPGPLSPAEWKLMYKHPEFGCAMLSRHSNLNDTVLQAVLQHHERMDGSGYPQRLKGEAISEYARIIAIADVYDAMTSNRCYKPSTAAHLSLEEILTNERLFDATYGRVLVTMLDIFPVGSRVLLANGAEGIVVACHPHQPTRPQLLLIKDPKGAPLNPPVPLDLTQRKGIEIIKVVAD